MHPFGFALIEMPEQGMRADRLIGFGPADQLFATALQERILVIRGILRE
jgi:hypothetical protein